jgi:hypothetical protein
MKSGITKVQHINITLIIAKMVDMYIIGIRNCQSANLHTYISISALSLECNYNIIF